MTIEMRECSKCSKVLELNEENFHLHHSKLYFMNACKECYRAYQREHRKKSVGRATSLLAGYRRNDIKRGVICSLTREQVEEIIVKPCTYCDSMDTIGVDRIDNDLGHTLENCQPCCQLCNFTKSNQFTHSEMLLLGEVIRQIRKSRGE